ncbi:MAG: hypothetical protein UX13_C0039G0011 [Candidatus Woesebacteria bacterium GW2011_GWB1_45_5]|uniref:Uncharacterized protein n=1 Tax=Candidatus Woesebacteria bacterium GW2011_GWB1_45_5 TaxID=1618581 RepID=A0A0G1MMB4_9BACT|nr:MAG: hypothetical protein UX13_C0039G0011 [Candidatus Woesebacteria bacterium GW2011_GWB1_45_5]
MEIKRYGEPIGLPNGYEALVLVGPPMTLNVNVSAAEGEGVFLYTDDGSVYIFDVSDIKCFDADFKLYVGTCCLMDRDEDTVEDVEGDSYLLIRHEGKIAHQGELWIEKITSD